MSRPQFRGFRVPSARLPLADYGAGLFFVTVVTAGRTRWPSRIVGGAVHLGAAGEIVAEEWGRTGRVRPGVTLDAFVVMPDHVHLILGLDGNARPVPNGGTGGFARPSIVVGSNVGVETPRRGVSTERGANVEQPDRTRARPASWRPGVLGAVINQFKGLCTRRIRADIHPSFAWQARYYDTIIRTERHLEQARRYVEFNPSRWGAP